MATAVCEIYREGKAENPGWRWRLVAANNRIIADGSEAYTTKSKAHEAFIRVANLSDTAKILFIKP